LFQSSSSKEKAESKLPSTSVDVKALSNDDPLWSFGTIKPRLSPLQKYFKPIPTDLDEESVNLQTAGNKFRLKKIYVKNDMFGNKYIQIFVLVSLISCLFGLSRFWQTLYPPQFSCSLKMLCESDDFENASITSKVWRQLQVIYVINYFL
jgi:hypothetical protein